MKSRARSRRSLQDAGPAPPVVPSSSSRASAPPQ
jgi:hypothetical protein